MNEVKSKYTLEGTEIAGQKVLAGNNHCQKKHDCPQCGKKRFVRFINIETLEYLPEHFGRCDREINCGYYLHPSDGNFQSESRSIPAKPIPKKPVQPSFIEKDKAKRTVNLESNKLFQFLTGKFDRESVSKVFKEYGIGTDTIKWPGAAIFYQIDLENRIRGGKVIDYKPDGHRVKGNATWVHSHSLWKLENFNMVQCLFGLHLLNKYPEKPVCIVEAEKTAVIASIYWPDYLWLATGGLSSKPFEKCKVLTGQRAILIPDVGATDEWKAVANDLNQLEGGDFHVFDFLESNASGEYAGFDLADFIIQSETSRKQEASEYFITSTGIKVWDKSGLLRASGLDFLCTPELEGQWDKPLTKMEQNFETMKAQNPKIQELKDRLGLQIQD